MIYDFIVVGSGSVGSAAGYYATKAGLKVLMIDNGHPPHEQGSHHGDTRLIRHAYGEGERYVPMLLRAQQLWYELEKQSGEHVMHRCGMINIGPEEHPFMVNVLKSARQFELPIDILTPEETMKRWPQISMPDGYIAIYESDAGYLKSETAVQTFVRLAKEAGCAQLFNSPVDNISRDGEFQKVSTINGSFLGRKILISAGTWVTKLLPDLPITPTRNVFSWHKSDDRYNESNNFPGFLIMRKDGAEFYGFPANKNVMKIGAAGGLPINRPEERKPFGEISTDNNDLSERLREFFPGVSACLYGKSCTLAHTPDGDFIIDTLPNEPNRLIIGGLSGHGFKFASVLGEIATAFAQNRTLPFDLKPFSLSRFGDKH